MPIRKNMEVWAGVGTGGKRESKDNITRERGEKSHLSFILSIGGVLYRNTSGH